MRQPAVSAYLRMTKTGKRLSIFFGGMTLDEIGGLGDIAVFFGSGDHEGKVLLSRAPDDKPFKVTKATKGSGRLMLPAPDRTPDRDTTTEPCHIEKSVADDGWIVTLPIGKWNSAGPIVPKPKAVPNPRVSGAEPTAAQVRAAKQDDSICEGVDGKIDATDYLRKKGHELKIIRGRIQLDGEIVADSAILSKINFHRNARGLPPLNRDGVRFPA
jgi:hypothetical protein